ncbi:MAG: endonuclease/exonuclease/phosphatase family protein [Bacteroidales bacterium]|jgi:endonuclease/exonuclease/phosphatase family metal-dependent hydrolase|nr:endonuclease/exonuclease/phosphatase family protein [Bacteroidales bacterium]
MKILKYILKLLIILVALFVLFLIYASVADFRPDIKKTIFQSTSPDTIDVSSGLSLMIWNIGYSGLGDDMDFFYDGGKQVRTSQERTLENFNFIRNFLEKNDTLDFILLQEVDIRSRRSYRINQYDSLKKILNGYFPFFATNYDVKFVPSPATNPLGSVKSGLTSFTRYQPRLVTRYSFPGNYSWPVSLFMLDRCFLVKRFPTTDQKELLVINTHNSAYDDGSLKKQQMEYLKKFLLAEYNRGNYIIVGGDWNQNPPEIDYSAIRKNSPTKRFVLNPIPADYLPREWTWVYDPDTPTNRYLNAPYEQGVTITPIIDFYLMSPNINPGQVKAHHFNFKNTDHQPVISKISFE